MIGMDADYVSNGHSYYTVETHVMQVDEIGTNKPIYSTAQVLLADAKRLHVFYRLRATEDDRLLASAEAMYLHVDRNSGRVCEASPDIVAKASKIADAHAQLPRPETAGRYVGQRKRG
jgi:carnitine 3-dehydrogenase